MCISADSQTHQPGDAFSQRLWLNNTASFHLAVRGGLWTRNSIGPPPTDIQIGHHGVAGNDYAYAKGREDIS